MTSPTPGESGSLGAKLRALLEPFEQREARAAARLAEEEGGPFWFFAVLGLNTEVDHFDLFESRAHLRKVEDAPGDIELAAALHDAHLRGAIGRYSHNIRHEIRVARGSLPDSDSFELGWSLVLALRTRTLAEILVPAVSDHSWSTMAAIKDHRCRAHLLEDAPQARRLVDPVAVTADDLRWVSATLLSFIHLRSTPHFQLAVEALATHHHQTSERMMVAILWSGIEALFGIQSELRFRLAALVAATLEPRGATRTELYHRVTKLYDVRSVAVHGGKVSNARLRVHAIEVRSLLSRLLCSFVDTRNLPSREESEKLLFE